MLKLRSRTNKAISKLNIAGSKILRISTNPNLPLPLRMQTALLVDEMSGRPPDGFVAILYRYDAETIYGDITNHIVISENLDYLSDGDIIRISDNLAIRTLYRKNANINYFLVTEQCDSYCLMCSQPPKPHDDSYLLDEILDCIPLIDRHTSELGITGGEPFLHGDKLFKLISKIGNYLPNCGLHILTNGKVFSDSAVAKRLSDLNHHDLMLGIPLYSDIPDQHDYIVQSAGAFNKTIKGLINLKTFGNRVELRVVLHAENIARLEALASFIARNLQFVDQVSLMGLEVTGFARANLDALWIDPINYREELKSAVEILTSAKVRVLIFNHQLCTLDSELWEYAVKSISDWKSGYLKACDECDVKVRCGGVFETSREKVSENITPIKL